MSERDLHVTVTIIEEFHYLMPSVKFSFILLYIYAIIFEHLRYANWI